MKPTVLELELERILGAIRKGRFNESEFLKSVSKSHVSRERFSFLVQQELATRGIEAQKTEEMRNILRYGELGAGKARKSPIMELKELSMPTAGAFTSKLVEGGVKEKEARKISESLFYTKAGRSRGKTKALPKMATRKPGAEEQASGLPRTGVRSSRSSSKRKNRRRF